MATESEWQASLPLFDHGNKIAIAQLSPDTHHVGASHVEANVALIWPYSNSTRRISLLLAEKDVRLRKSKGQVKVTFHGECAREVAQTQVGIGDEVRLGLKYAQWSETGEEVATPGRKVGWDVHIKRHVELEVKKGHGGVVVVNFTGRSPSPPTIKSSVAETSHPQTNGIINIQNPLLPRSTPLPARRVHPRLSSGSFVDASLDPFADDDGYIVGRGRKRTKFARHSGSWQLLENERQESKQNESSMAPDRLPSPEQDVEPHHTPGDIVDISSPPQAVVEEPSVGVGAPLSTTLLQDAARTGQRDSSEPSSNTSDGTAQVPSTDLSMQPPPIPPFGTPQRKIHHTGRIDTQSTMTPTPVIRPLPSPGLALVSPLVGRHGFATEYFPPMSRAQSDLDAISYTPVELHGHPPGEWTEPYALTAEPVVQEAPALLGDINQHGAEQFVAPIGDANIDYLESASGLQERNLDLHSNPPQEILSKLDTTAPHSDIIDLTSATTGDVDLDALQEQIEATNQELQGVVTDQTKDGDILGSQSDVHGEDRQGAEALYPDLLSSKQLSQTIEPPQEQHSTLTQAAIPVDSTLLNSEVSQAHSQTTQPAIVIDSSSDAATEDTDTDTDSSSEISEDEEFEEDLDLERELERELGADDETDDSLSRAENTERPEIESRRGISPISEHRKQASLLAIPSTGPSRNQPQLDGLNEPYEDEDQRRVLRAALTKAAASPGPVSADLLESRTEPGSLQNGSDAIEVHMENPGGRSEIHIATDFRGPGMGPTLAAIDNEQQQLGFSVELSDVSLPSVEHQQIPPRDYKQHNVQAMTPDATQSTGTSKTPAPESDVLPLILPLTPGLTQDSQIHAPVASLTRLPLSSPNRTDKTEPALPDPVGKDAGSAPRASQRLSRKLFVSEQISTEYFTPRRSSRIVQSSPTFPPDQAQAVKQPTSPVRPKRTLGTSPPLVSPRLLDTIASSPTLQRGITTPLAYFSSLSSVHEHFDSRVDVLVVCSADSTPPQKAKSGPKDYHTTLYLVDPSFTNDDTAIGAQIFRPQKDALPVPKRGDCVLLRNMKVQTNKHKIMLLSTESSGWVVFRHGPGKLINSVVNGPPVEYGEGEIAEAGHLLDWWSVEGIVQHPDLQLPTGQIEEARQARSTSPMLTRSQRRKLDATDQQSNASEQEPTAGHVRGGAANSFTQGMVARDSQDPTSPITAVSTRQTRHTRTPSSPTVPVRTRGHRRNNSERSESIVHELRDGTTYIDEGGRPRGASVIHELRDGNTYVDQ